MRAFTNVTCAIYTLIGFIFIFDNEGKNYPDRSYDDGHR